MQRWKGRVAIVTGASSGIGAAVAVELTRHGMKVAALARRLPKLQSLQKECINCEGVLKVYKCDVSDEDDIKATVTAVLNDLGPISVLINNAAQIIQCPLTEPTVSCRKQYETNVIGLVTMTQYVVDSMKKNNITDGHIINVNSVVGHYVSPMPQIGNYCASKHATKVVTETLKNELSGMKFRTRVTNISPGFVTTEMSDPFKDYVPSNLLPLTTKDTNDCIIFALSVNPNVNISELTVHPTGETMFSYVSKTT